MQTAVLQSLTLSCLPACPPPLPWAPAPRETKLFSFRVFPILPATCSSLLFLIFIYSNLHRTFRTRLPFFPHPIGPHMSFPMSHEPSMILFWFGLTALNTAEIVCVYLLISSLPYWNTSSVKARTFSNPCSLPNSKHLTELLTHIRYIICIYGGRNRGKVRRMEEKTEKLP